MMLVRLTPVDTWHVGTGIPSQTGSASQLVQAGVFPPHPPTVVGAVRAALARSQGWDGDGRWSPALNPVLGDGPQDLGALSFLGPFVLGRGPTGERPLVPVPAATRLVEDARLALAVRPAEESVDCDLGAVRLPEIRLPESGPGKPADGYLGIEQVRALLAGEPVLAEELVSTGSLWAIEERIGLARTKSRTAQEGMLFRIVHHRPIVHHRARPPSFAGLLELVSGLPGDWQRPVGLHTLGAEARMAELSVVDGDLGLPGAPSDTAEVERTGRAVLSALTPVLLSPGAWRGTEDLPGLPGSRVVCGVAGRGVRVGGWDGRTASPVAQRSALPAGSVLYVQHPDGAALAAALQGPFGLAQLGDRMQEGFGAAVAAPWPG